MGNMVDVSRTAFDGDALLRLSSVLHESQNATRRGLDRAVPASLAGLAAHAARRQGARELLGAFRGGEYPHLGPEEVSHLVDSPEQTALLAQSGERFLSEIFGDNLDSAVETIAEQSGVSRASAHTLLGLAVPLVLEAVGKEAESRHLGVRGLSRFLDDQARAAGRASSERWDERTTSGEVAPSAARRSTSPVVAARRARLAERILKGLMAMVFLAFVALVIGVLFRPWASEVARRPASVDQRPASWLARPAPMPASPPAQPAALAMAPAAPATQASVPPPVTQAPAQPPAMPASAQPPAMPASAQPPVTPASAQPPVTSRARNLHLESAALSAPILPPAPATPTSAGDAIQSVAQAETTAPAPTATPHAIAPPTPTSTRLGALPSSQQETTSSGGTDLEARGVLARERSLVLAPAAGRALPRFLDTAATPPRRFELRDVPFKANSAVIEGENSVLNVAAKALREHPNVQLLLEGHADGVVERERADSLSLARADSVKRYLVAHGVAPERLRAVGFGAHRLPSEEHAPKIESRRVDLVVVKR